MISGTFNRFLGTALLGLLIVFTAACDERSISPLEESRGSYSIYGALSLDQSENYIRVRDLTVPFLSDSSKNIDAVVTFEDLGNGTTTTLRDSVVNFGGDYTHNFVVEQQLEPNQSYQVRVEGSNGVSVTSTATTPAITEVELSTTPTPEGEVLINCTSQNVFSYRNVVEPERIRMEVGFEYQGQVHWAEVGKVAQLEHRDDSDVMEVRMSPRNLLVEVFPPPGIDNPALNPRFLSPTVDCDELDSNVVRIRYDHFGPEWDNINPARGPLDPLDSPDVEGGLGFLGAYRSGSYTFQIRETLESTAPQHSSN